MAKLEKQLRESREREMELEREVYRKDWREGEVRTTNILLSLLVTCIPKGRKKTRFRDLGRIAVSMEHRSSITYVLLERAEGEVGVGKYF